MRRRPRPPVGRPAETARVLAGDPAYGMGCAGWAALAGVVCFAVFAAVAISIT